VTGSGEEILQGDGSENATQQSCGSRRTLNINKNKNNNNNNNKHNNNSKFVNYN
jgi:hypothetical protein